MQKTYDIHVEKFERLISPSQLKDRVPVSDAAIARWSAVAGPLPTFWKEKILGCW